MKIDVESCSCEIAVLWDWPAKVTKDEVELEKKVIFRVEPGTTVAELKELIIEHDRKNGEHPRSIHPVSCSSALPLF